MDKYRYFNHTADLGLEVFGGNLSELFNNAAEGLYSILFDGAPAPLEKKTLKVELSETDIETLLVEWLNELLFCALTRKLYFSKSKISISENKLVADLSGYNFDCCFKREIKAATYHNLKINKVDSGFEAKIIFDV